MTIDPRIEKQIEAQPHPLLFVTISGAHLYGFPSPDSDYDLRGAHVVPLDQAAGLIDGQQTIQREGVFDGLEIDLVTHEVRKFFEMMLKKNGYVLEQLFSPLKLRTGPEHEELIAIGKTCVTRYHAYHYLGFAETQWKLFEKENPRRVKPLLYVFRVLLTGIHLMRSGLIEANLLTLNEEFKLPYIGELVGRKLAGAEQSTLHGNDFEIYSKEYVRLRGELETAFAESKLPEASGARDALHDLLLRIRKVK